MTEYSIPELKIKDTEHKVSSVRQGNSRAHQSAEHSSPEHTYAEHSVREPIMLMADAPNSLVREPIGIHPIAEHKFRKRLRGK